ncbi:MAG: tyrosine-type recombinase/integrase [Magnetococcales bacterium]|nr:tyrosine-type recombinase/integrase [Magnetococcales bacterium]
MNRETTAVLFFSQICHFGKQPDRKGSLKYLEQRMSALSTSPYKKIEFSNQIGSSQSVALTGNTLAAYSGDLRRYFDWGGSIPSASKAIADYLTAHSKTHKYATLVRWKVSIGKAHTNQGLEDPSKSATVHAALVGIRSSYGKEQRKVAPLVKEQILAIVDTMGDRIKDKRDKALLLSGFAAGLRRSEIISLLVSDLLSVNEDIEIRLQEGNAVLLHANSYVCPVRALKDWLSAAKIKDGPVFRPINRHGQLSGSPLSGHGVALIVKERVQAIGLDPSEYSGLSLRAGFMASDSGHGWHDDDHLL